MKPINKTKITYVKVSNMEEVVSVQKLFQMTYPLPAKENTNTENKNTLLRIKIWQLGSQRSGWEVNSMLNVDESVLVSFAATLKEKSPVRSCSTVRSQQSDVQNIPGVILRWGDHPESYHVCYT